jgi:thiamine biosynthesis lipoprotein
MIAVAATTSATGVPPTPADDVGAEFAVMASRAVVRVSGLCAPDARAAIEAAVAEVRRIEAKYSRYREDSIVSRINAAAGSGQAVTVDDETAGLLDFADALYVQSGGRFDITSGVLRRAWDFRSGRLPDPRRLEALVSLIGWSRVRRARGADGTWSVALPAEGMEIDFGGFGKEYAADRAAALLVSAGARGGFVNLGGDLRVIGPDAHGAPWRFGIQHPRAADGVIGSIELAHGALATSGDYERFMEIDGRRYCHILDPRTGWPVDAWQSISVVAPVCLAAGALTTTAMLAGAGAEAFLRSQGARYFAVSASGAVIRAGL